MIIQGQVQPPPTTSGTPGQNYPLIQGKQLDAMVSELHGKYYTQTVNGNVFHGSTAAAGVLIPISTATGVTFGLWNPLGSGKNAVLIRFTAGWVSTTGAPGNILYMVKTGVGAQVATGGPITAATFGTATNGLLGASTASAMNFIPGTLTLAAAGAIIR